MECEGGVRREAVAICDGGYYPVCLGDSVYRYVPHMWVERTIRIPHNGCEAASVVLHEGINNK
jgi:hypothetical protein